MYDPRKGGLETLPNRTTVFWSERSARLALVLPLLAALWLCTGCAAKVPLRPEAKGAIRSVSIDKSVPTPKDIFYHSTTQGMSADLPLVGGLLANIAAARGTAQLERAMLNGGIDPGQILREQFESGLRSAGVFSSILSEGGDAEVKLQIITFGFMEDVPSSSQLKPILVVMGTLVRPDGSVVWKGSSDVTALNSDTPSHTLEEYVKDPQSIREALTVAAKVAVDDLVKSMREA
jgi:hypothetical protein